jgi:hypothetical protein
MRYYGYYSYPDNVPSKYSCLVGLFGGAVDDIKMTFLEFHGNTLDAVLRTYSALYGDQAGKYARKTFPMWQCSVTKLSGRTMERLIDLVPPYLSPEQRFHLLQKVLQKNKPSKPCKSIRINMRKPITGVFTQLYDMLASMQHRDVLAYLPERVMKAASWLYANDITAARTMIAEAERKENDIILANATREIALLKRTVQLGQVKSGSYFVEMPAGILSVELYKSFWL